MEFVQWLQDYVFELVSGVSIVTFLTFLYRHFVVSIVPTILKWVKQIVIQVVSKAFGFEVTDENIENIDKLPFVEKFDQLANNIQTQNELKLIELKQKLKSPIYTDLEKIPIENLYKVLYEKIKTNLSAETLQVLEMLENMSKPSSK